MIRPATTAPAMMSDRASVESSPGFVAAPATARDAEALAAEDERVDEERVTVIVSSLGAVDVDDDVADVWTEVEDEDCRAVDELLELDDETDDEEGRALEEDTVEEETGVVVTRTGGSTTGDRAMKRSGQPSVSIAS